MAGGAGADTLDGPGGSDTASYSDSNAAVRIDLSGATATGGHATGDSLADIENLLGSRYSDLLTGDAGPNRLEGGPGNNLLTGGPGANTAVYAGSDAAVTVNLLEGTASGGDAEGDTLSSIENLTGSAHDDTFTGDASRNVLEGGPRRRCGRHRAPAQPESLWRGRRRGHLPLHR